MARLGLILSNDNARGRGSEEGIEVVILERCLLDPPRQAAMTRWCAGVRRRFPRAELIPVAWHLVTHGREDGLRSVGQRRPAGQELAFGGLQPTPEVEQAWQVTRQCMVVCESDRVVLKTPPSLTPGALGRKRLREFVAARAAEHIQLCWDPEGLWEPDTTVPFARELGVTPLCSAFAAGRPQAASLGSSLLVGDGAWLRVDGFGPHAKVGSAQVDALLDHLEVAPATTIIFSGPKALANLREVARAIGSEPHE